MLDKKVLTVILAVVAVAVTGSCFYPRQSLAQEPKKFSGRQQLVEYIKTNSYLMRGGLLLSGDAGGPFRGTDTLLPAGESARSFKQEAAAGDRVVTADGHSVTNAQVAGVDEADVVKNDGRYLFIASANRVHIVEAYPAEKGKLLSTIDCGVHPEGLFLKDDRLVVIGRQISGPGMQAIIYNIADRKHPVETNTFSWEGGYVDSRMIGGYVYLILYMPVYIADGDVKLPQLTENGRLREIQPADIYYFDYPDRSYRYTMIVAINTVDDGRQSACRTFLTGASQIVYASQDNLYLTGAKAPDLVRLIDKFIDGLASLVDGGVAEKIRKIRSSAESPDKKIVQVEMVLEEYISGLGYAEAAALEERINRLRRTYYNDMRRESNKTEIHKFSVRDAVIDYRCRGEAGGRLLNQFSMDEHKGYFRLATTSEGFLLGEEQSTRNNIYVLNEDLKVVGKLEGLAISERIYSARFMGDRAYLVTFRNIDPLFVIDLKDPADPRVLGELKIPGYSDYLHPYDENYLIGVGKDVPPGPETVPVPVFIPGGTRPLPGVVSPPPARPQGVKIALFDVSNPARPMEVSRYVVDGAYSDTEVSHNHKAFLFSRERNLMALPISSREAFPVNKGGRAETLSRLRQGMYVFHISPAEGIRLKGKISHRSGAAGTGDESGEQVKRAAYINDVFYTISEGMVKMSRVDDLREIKVIPLLH